MPLKTKPLSDTELAEHEAARDLAAELLLSVRQMQAGQVRVVPLPVAETRKKNGLTAERVRRQIVAPKISRSAPYSSPPQP